MTITTALIAYGCCVALGVILGGLLWLLWPTIYRHHIVKPYEQRSDATIDWEFCVDPLDELSVHVDDSNELRVELAVELTAWDDEAGEGLWENRAGWRAVRRWYTVAQLSPGLIGFGLGGIFNLLLVAGAGWTVYLSLPLAALWGWQGWAVHGLRLIVKLMEREPNIFDDRPESRPPDDTGATEQRLRLDDDIGAFAVWCCGSAVTVTRHVRVETAGEVCLRDNEAVAESAKSPQLLVPAWAHEQGVILEPGETAYVIGYRNGGFVVVGRDTLIESREVEAKKPPTTVW